MTAYFMLCFVMPILNAGIKAMDKRSLGGLILLLLGIICGESLVCSVGALGVEGGYSFAWLVVLYVVGAYIRLYNPLDKPKALLLYAAAVSAMIAGWMPLAISKLPLPSGLPRLFEFGGYTSPFTVIIAMCVFAICLQLRIRSTRLTKFITYLSSTSLGVYLIHVQPLFMTKIFCREAQKLSVYDGGGYLFYLITMTMGVYLICTALDVIRLMAFKLVDRLYYRSISHVS
jgi:surface polysaccharide O-acyltransferase-like enzyme